MIFQMIAPNEIEQYIQDKNSLIIDLREQNDYKKKHIKNAVNVPYLEWNRFENSEMFRKIRKRKKIILYCERGPTSFAVAKELAGKEIPVSVVVGGIHACHGKILEGY